MLFQLRTYLFVLLLCLFNQSGFSQHWQWIKSSAGSGGSVGYGIATDDKGNSYVTGLFTGTVTFDGFTLTSPDASAAYIAKYNSVGKVVWAKRVAHQKTIAGYSIAVDGKGNIYISGYGAKTKAIPQYGGIFISKYSSNGDLIWTQQAKGGNLSSDIAVDGAGNSYITGKFSNTITLGTINLNGKDFNTFVAKLDPEGKVIWADGFEDSNLFSDQNNGISVDAFGNAYVTGSFENTTTVGPITLTSNGYHDVFLVKYSPGGTVIWAKQAGGSGRDVPIGVAVDAHGDCYITGGSNSKNLRFGSFNLTNVSIYDNNYGFITKYDADGEVIWARQSVSPDLDAGGTNGSGYTDLAIDKENNIFVIGGFGGFGGFFGQVTIGDITLKGMQNYNLFVVKFNSTGEVVWAKQGGNFGSDITVDIKGNCYVTGHFETPVSFDNYQLSVPDELAYMFIGKIGSSMAPGTPSKETVSIPNIITPNGDGLNDTFVPYLPENRQLHLKIYNRWGKMVYEQKNYQNTWDGADQSDGSYYYLLTTDTGQSWKGWVEINK